MRKKRRADNVDWSKRAMCYVLVKNEHVLCFTQSTICVLLLYIYIAIGHSLSVYCVCYFSFGY